MCDDRAGDIHGIALRERYQARRHLRILRIWDANEIFRILIEFALADVAGDTDNFGPLLAVVERHAPSDGILAVKEVIRGRLIDDRDERLVWPAAAIETTPG